MTDKINSRLKSLEGQAQPVYKNLSPKERLRLDILATASGDEAEANRLIESCPRKNYTMCDKEVVDREDAFSDLLSAMVVDSAFLLEKLNFCNRLIRCISILNNLMDDNLSESFSEGWRAAGGKFNDDFYVALEKAQSKLKISQKSAALLVKKLTSTTNKHRMILRSRWAAFDKICLELVGVDAQTALASLGNEWDDDLRGLSEILNSDTQPDPEHSQDHFNRMQLLWDQKVN